MNPTPRVPPEQFVESMKEEMEQYLKKVMEAVNRPRTASGSPGARNVFVTSRRRCAAASLNGRCSSGWTRRKPLFPPPHHPTTGKRLANKGRQSRSVLTINGRIRLRRRWWYAAQAGSIAPADEILDRSGATITPGALELACRENLSATSFARAAANLARTAQLTLSGEQLRKEVEAAGRRVMEAQETGRIDTAWKAEDCRLPGEKEGKTTRVYTGCDGVMVPVITEAEKLKRRAAIKAKRRRCGKRCKPLPPRRHGADQAWKEFKVVYFYSEDMRRQHVAFTHRNHEAAGKLMRREADRLRFRQATQRVAVVDGATWIREQMQLHLAELDGLGLDFYHLSENVHRARREVFGEDAPEGRRVGRRTDACVQARGVWRRVGTTRPVACQAGSFPQNARPPTGY